MPCISSCYKTARWARTKAGFKVLPCVVSVQVSEEVATICAMVSIGSAVFYRPKDKQVHADNAHKQFSRGGVGDHIMLMNVYQVCPGWKCCGD